MGDLKLVERPQNYTLPPGASKTIRCVLRCTPQRTTQIRSRALCAC
jgi:hypothetical protein